MKFQLNSQFVPKGDQPQAILALNKILKKQDDAVLLGATGTGKTFTIANVIANLQLPTLILAPNKTLANQLYVEFKQLFPNNRVEYFISNFDYYQPEAYKPQTDTFIEKSSVQNWQIEMMRMSTLNALTSRKDVIVIASVAAIYGLRDPQLYLENHLELIVNQKIRRNLLLGKLVKLGYKRNPDSYPGSFQVNGDVIELRPSWSDQFCLRISFFGDEIESIEEIDSLNKTTLKHHDSYTLIPADSNVAKPEDLPIIIKQIRDDLLERQDYFAKNNLLLERERLTQRVNFDLEQLEEFGITSGIENYSLYLDKRHVGEPPFTIFDYFPNDFLMVIDESHLSLPQIRGMYEGDRSRKLTLVKYGFRLPTALDNRPLKFPEFEQKLAKTIYVSATPGDFEIDKTGHQIVEQIIRPTGLLDPIIEVRSELNQIDDLITEIKLRKAKNQRVFITTTTKKLSEDIAVFMSSKGISVAYMHSDLKTFEREEVIRKLRLGIYDAIIGINLLREGLDVPEVSLVAILDAAKNGFLRNTRSLIQITGRAARNAEGKVIMYAASTSSSMQQAIEETNRRRAKQLEYNTKYHITPQTIIKAIPNPLIKELETSGKVKLSKLTLTQKIKELELAMTKAAKEYDFETAIKLRDLITELRGPK